MSGYAQGASIGPNEGQAAAGKGPDDIEITDATKGVILRSADNSRWRITANNDGSMTLTKLVVFAVVFLLASVCNQSFAEAYTTVTTTGTQTISNKEITSSTLGTISISGANISGAVASAPWQPRLGLVSETDAVPFGADDVAGPNAARTMRKRIIIHPCSNPRFVTFNCGRVTAASPGLGKAEGIDANCLTTTMAASIERITDTTIYVSPDHWGNTISFGQGITVWPAIPLSFLTTETVYSRIYVDTSTLAHYRGTYPAVFGYSGAGDPPYTSGEGSAVGNYTSSGTIAGAYGFGNNNPGPGCLLGEVAEPSGVLVIGDSTSAGVGAVWDGLGTWNQSAFHGRAPYLTCGVGQDLVTNFLIPKYSAMRFSLVPYVRDVVICAGINDVSNGKSAATIIAAYISIADRCKALGAKRVFVMTPCPATTSTDGWMTVSGQTAAANDASIRQPLLASLRAGALGTHATLIDTAALVESGTSGKWNDSTELFSGVPSAKPIAHSFQFSGQNWTTNQWKGKTLYSVTGTKFTTVVSNNADTLYTVPNTIVVTDSCKIITNWTNDGTHFSQNTTDIISGTVRSAMGL